MYKASREGYAALYTAPARPSTVRYADTPEGCLEQVTDQNEHMYVHNYYDMNGRVMRRPC